MQSCLVTSLINIVLYDFVFQRLCYSYFLLCNFIIYALHNACVELMWIVIFAFYEIEPSALKLCLLLDKSDVISV